MENDYFKKQVIYIVYRSVTLHAVDMVYQSFLAIIAWQRSISSFQQDVSCAQIYLISTVCAIDVPSIIELTEEVTVVVQKARWTGLNQKFLKEGAALRRVDLKK